MLAKMPRNHRVSAAFRKKISPSREATVANLAALSRLFSTCSFLGGFSFWSSRGSSRPLATPRFLNHVLGPTEGTIVC